MGAISKMLHSYLANFSHNCRHLWLNWIVLQLYQGPTYECLHRLWVRWFPDIKKHNKSSFRKRAFWTKTRAWSISGNVYPALSLCVHQSPAPFLYNVVIENGLASLKFYSLTNLHFWTSKSNFGIPEWKTNSCPVCWCRRIIFCIIIILGCDSSC